MFILPPDHKRMSKDIKMVPNLIRYFHAKTESVGIFKSLLCEEQQQGNSPKMQTENLELGIIKGFVAMFCFSICINFISFSISGLVSEH